MLSSAHLIALHDRTTAAWHQDPAFDLAGDPLDDLMLHQHRENYDLWHEEDLARSPQASDHDIAELKHEIDRTNQRRNDLVEQIDSVLLKVAGSQNPSAPLHSESPGLIIDRLSILALKIFHTAEEAHRASALEAHRARNLERLRILQTQRADLAACLDELWQQVLSGQRRFAIYRQLKMYNDPELNPVLYSHRASS